MGDPRGAELAETLAARRGGGDHLRLFFGLKVPNEHKLALAKVLDPMRLKLPYIRWIPKENWHLTLCFLGEVNDARIDDMRELGRKAAQVSSAPRLELRDIGAFPSSKRARVLWAGVNDEDEATAKLAATLTALTSESGLREQRRFKAHLTVGRLKESQDLSQCLADAEVRTTPFVCERLTLFSSRLSPKGSIYENVDEWPLSERGDVR